MDFDLSDEQREIQGTARELLSARCTPAAVRAAAESRKQDGELWREVSQLGWPGIAIDAEHGGQGLGLVELCVVLEQAGAALAPIPLLPSAGAALVLERAGSDAQRQRWLPGLAAGEAHGAVGSRPGKGAEALIAGDPQSQPIALVDAGSALLIDPTDPTLEPLESIDPLRSYLTLGESSSGGRDVAGESGDALAGKSVNATAGEPEDAHAGQSGDAPAGEPLPGDVETGALAAAVAVAAESVGVADRALQMTISYVKERRQFDTPVGAFQAVSHRCAEMLLHTEQARSAVYQAAWAADAEPSLLPAAASLAKALASEAVVSVTASAIQAHGGIGFTWEADVHWLFKRAHMNARLLGGAGEHRRALAAAIGMRAPA